MGLFAMAINTGSIAQDGGTNAAGLRFDQISGSGMIASVGSLNWSDYRPLAKGRLGEELSIFLLVSDCDVIISNISGIVPAYWDEVATLQTPISGTLGLQSQRSFYLPRYRGTNTSFQSATASTSSWQWVDGLDLTVKAYNDNNIGNEYLPGLYGWFLGVAKSGTPGGWNVESWFWGVTGSRASEAQASFTSVFNSLPTGFGQTSSANFRNYGPTDGNTLLQDSLYSSFFKIDPNNGEVANYVAIYNEGTDITDVGKPGFLSIITGPGNYW